MKPWELLGQTRAPDGAELSLTAAQRRIRHPGQRQEPDVEPHARLGGGAGDVRLGAHPRPRGAARPGRRPRHGIHPARHARSPSAGRHGRRRGAAAGGGGVEPRPARAAGRTSAEGSARARSSRATSRSRSGRASTRSTRSCSTWTTARPRSPRPGTPALYNDAGLAAARTALKEGGVLAVWSAREDRKFEQRLRYAGFRVEVERVRGRLKKGGPRHTIFLAFQAIAVTTVSRESRGADAELTRVLRELPLTLRESSYDSRSEWTTARRRPRPSCSAGWRARWPSSPGRCRAGCCSSGDRSGRPSVADRKPMAPPPMLKPAIAHVHRKHRDSPGCLGRVQHRRTLPRRTAAGRTRSTAAAWSARRSPITATVRLLSISTRARIA